MSVIPFALARLLLGCHSRRRAPRLTAATTATAGGRLIFGRLTLLIFSRSTAFRILLRILTKQEAESFFGPLIIPFQKHSLTGQQIAIIRPVAVGMQIEYDGDLLNSRIHITGDGQRIVGHHVGIHRQELAVIVLMGLTERYKCLLDKLFRIEVAVVVRRCIVPGLTQS